MSCLWKEPLKNLNIKGTEANPLLEQSFYDEIFTVLVSEYFASQSTHISESAEPPVELTSDELNAMRCRCVTIPC